jgi:oleandomycin transport system ATP-binding protein
MRRRLDLAASLVGRPRFLYLDEPTTGLDPLSRQQLWEMIRGLVADGTTVLLTTQYLEEADRLADEIVVIDHGRVIAAGTPRQLKERVGGHVLEVHTVEPDDAPRAAEVLREFARDDTTVHHERGRALATIEDRACLTAVVRRLDEERIALDDLALRRSSLDEVFIALTGHVAEPEPDLEELAERSTV